MSLLPLCVSSTSASASQEGIAIIGFGYVGTVLAVFLAERGYDVLAIDNQAKIIEEIKAGKPHLKEPNVEDSLAKFVRSEKLKIDTSYKGIQNSDVIIVTVGTPLGGHYSADLTALESCIEAICPYLCKGQLLILKSTLPPGTTRNVVAPILKRHGIKPGSDIFLSFCPERLAEGNAMNEMKELPVVVSGIDEESALRAESFWKRVGLETIPVKSLEAAELTKLADNVWIDVNVALSNELARVCESVGVDAMDVIRAANSLPKGPGKVNFLTPGVGVGGSCLTKDPWFLVDFAKSKQVQLELPQVARRVNDHVPAFIVNLIESELKKKNCVPRDTRVAVLGYAFKGSTSDTRNSPAKEIISKLSSRGFTVSVYDPWVQEEVIIRETDINPSSSTDDCLRSASAILVLADHPEFKNLEVISNSKALKSAIVFDGWHIFDPRSIVELGFDYFSPGAFQRRAD